MAEIVRRRSWGGVLPLGRQASISGSSLIQCASASIAPPHPGGAKCYPGAEVQGRTGPNSMGNLQPHRNNAPTRPTEVGNSSDFYTGAVPLIDVHRARVIGA